MPKKESKIINRFNEISKLPKIKMPRLKLDNIDRIDELRMDFEKYVNNAPKVIRRQDQPKKAVIS